MLFFIFRREKTPSESNWIRLWNKIHGDIIHYPFLFDFIHQTVSFPNSAPFFYKKYLIQTSSIKRLFSHKRTENSKKTLFDQRSLEEKTTKSMIIRKSFQIDIIFDHTIHWLFTQSSSFHPIFLFSCTRRRRLVETARFHDAVWAVPRVFASWQTWIILFVTN